MYVYAHTHICITSAVSAGEKKLKQKTPCAGQVPAPFVVLAQFLPMAVLYDPATLDLGDASVADRLRKQAKTRAVKVLSLFRSLVVSPCN